MPNPDFFAMSDEEILAATPPEITEDAPSDEENQEQEENNTAQENQENQETTEEQEETSGSEENSENDNNGAEESNETDPANTNKQEQQENNSSEPEIDYKQFYTAMMSPIKANGKTLQVRTPQEAVKLMQMGANYTHKMQSIAPYRKKVQMLQNAGLFDDDKLNYIIDIAQGKPEAIKQLLKDHKLDPMDFDTSEASNYTPSNHTVSDTEVQVQSIVDDLKSTPEGQETLQLIRNWDQASLDEVWKDPSIMNSIYEQRSNGVYKMITDEMEHQRQLGNIPLNTPFLDAYKAVGEALLQQKTKREQMQRVVQNLPQGTLTRVKTPTNNAQVKSASPSGRSKKSTTTFVDPFSLSDEEFEKQFKNYSY